MITIGACFLVSSRRERRQVQTESDWHLKIVSVSIVGFSDFTSYPPWLYSRLFTYPLITNSFNGPFNFAIVLTSEMTFSIIYFQLALWLTDSQPIEVNPPPPHLEMLPNFFRGEYSNFPFVLHCWWPRIPQVIPKMIDNNLQSPRQAPTVEDGSSIPYRSKPSPFRFRILLERCRENPISKFSHASGVSKAGNSWLRRSLLQW